MPAAAKIMPTEIAVAAVMIVVASIFIYSYRYK